MKKFIKGVRFAPKNYSDEVEVKIQHYKKEGYKLPSRAVCARFQVFGSGVQPQFQVVTYNYRKQYPLFAAPLPDKFVCVHFVFERVVEQYGCCRPESGVCLEGGKYFSRLTRSGRAVSGLQQSYLPAQFFFPFHHLFYPL